jgi:hypothetical protein
LKTINTLRVRTLLAFCTFAVASAVSAASCGGSSGTDACASLQGKCGTACTDDASCASGLYCSAGKCTADCTASGTECSGNATCDAHGRCVAGSSSTSTSSGGGGDIGLDPVGSTSTSGTQSTGSSGCPDVSVTFTPETPTVMLLIDQSSSMTAGFPNDGDPSRWDVVYNTLMDPTNGVVKTLQDKVRFGLTLYTWSGQGTCPGLTQVKTPALNAYDAINSVWAPADPVNNTPTGDSINAITPQLVAFSAPGPKLILLATDGDPDDCSNPDSNGTDPPRKLATDAVQAAYKQGIETVVVAVGNEVTKAHQQDMANAGKGLPVPAPTTCTEATCAVTYTPTTQQAMIDAFLGIINGKRSCIFELSGQVEAGKECSGTVLLNGMPVTCNDANGWKLTTPTEIEFVGTACQSILSAASASVSATFPCGVITPPPK